MKMNLKFFRKSSCFCKSYKIKKLGYKQAPQKISSFRTKEVKVKFQTSKGSSFSVVIQIQNTTENISWFSLIYEFERRFFRCFCKSESAMCFNFTILMGKYRAMREYFKFKIWYFHLFCSKQNLNRYFCVEEIFSKKIYLNDNKLSNFIQKIQFNKKLSDKVVFNWISERNNVDEYGKKCKSMYLSNLIRDFFICFDIWI